MGALVAGAVSSAQEASSSENYPIEWSAGVSYLRPGLGDFDVYKSGAGMEAQYRHWLWDVQGVALSIGLERWSTKSDSQDWGARPRGSLSLLSLGVSWVGLLFESASDVWTLEAGLRYHIADSDVKIRVGDQDRKVDIQNGLTGLTALGYERRLSESLSVTATLSYQPDLMTGEASFDEGKLRDNKLEAWGLQLGLRWRL